MSRLAAFMVWAIGFELSIALATGRNPAEIKTLREDLAYWEGQRDRYEVQHG